MVGVSATKNVIDRLRATTSQVKHESRQQHLKNPFYAGQQRTSINKSSQFTTQYGTFYGPLSVSNKGLNKVSSDEDQPAFSVL